MCQYCGGVGHVTYLAQDHVNCKEYMCLIFQESYQIIVTRIERKKKLCKQRV